MKSHHVASGRQALRDRQAPGPWDDEISNQLRLGTYAMSEKWYSAWNQGSTQGGGGTRARALPVPIRLGALGRKGLEDGKMRSKSSSRASTAVLIAIWWLNWAH